MTTEQHATDSAHDARSMLDALEASCFLSPGISTAESERRELLATIAQRIRRSSPALHATRSRQQEFDVCLRLLKHLVSTATQNYGARDAL